MTSTNDTETNARDCPNCGLPREDWPDDARGGFAKEGVVYCCRGCIDGPGCTCKQYIDTGNRAPTKDQIRSDHDSGAFVQSLQHQTDHVGDEDYGTEVTKAKPSPSSSND